MYRYIDVSFNMVSFVFAVVAPCLICNKLNMHRAIFYKAFWYKCPNGVF